MTPHSSGITTSVLGALKRGLAGREQEIGIAVCGGRERHSRRTPEELMQFGDRTGVNSQDLPARVRGRQRRRLGGFGPVEKPQRQLRLFSGS